MPPQLALVLTVSFCAVMFWHHARRHRSDSAALWLPVLWVFFVASKFPTQWLQLFGLSIGGPSAPEDGSPLDAVFFLALILAGVVVLARRPISGNRLVGSNIWLTIFFVYCLLSIAWSDVPAVAFKRWIKILGHPVMALIIWTDRDPLEAIRSVLKRSAFVMVPLSILFIKYYPEYGRSFDPWTGEAFNAGIHLNKNELGYSAMVFAIFFFWHLVSSHGIRDRITRLQETAISVCFLALLWWIFLEADSATSLACTVLGCVLIALMSTGVVSRRFLGLQVVTVIAALVAIEVLFGAYESTVDMLGRDPTLTDRTELWSDVLHADINPVLGAGFESFWTGARRELLWEKWWWKPVQSHNGYIETYLNLGGAGIVLLGGVIFSTFRKGRAAFLRDGDEGRLRLAFLFAILAYNYTEAAFKGVHLVWTIFHVIAINYEPAPARVSAAAEGPLTRARSPLPASAAARAGTVMSGRPKSAMNLSRGIPQPNQQNRSTASAAAVVKAAWRA